MLKQEQEAPNNKNKQNFLVRFFTALLRLFSSLARVFTRRTPQEKTSNQINPSLKKALDLFESQFVSGGIAELMTMSVTYAQNMQQALDDNKSLDLDDIASTTFCLQAVSCAEAFVKRLQRLNPEKAGDRLTLVFDDLPRSRLKINYKNDLLQPLIEITSYLKEETVLEELGAFQRQIAKLRQKTLDCHPPIAMHIDYICNKALSPINEIRSNLKRTPLDEKAEKQEREMLSAYKKELAKNLKQSQGLQARRYLNNTNKTIKDRCVEHTTRLKALEQSLDQESKKDYPYTAQINEGPNSFKDLSRKRADIPFDGSYEMYHLDTCAMINMYIAASCFKNEPMKRYMATMSTDKAVDAYQTLCDSTNRAHYDLRDHLQSRETQQEPDLLKHIYGNAYQNHLEGFGFQFYDNKKRHYRAGLYGMVINFVIAEALLPITKDLDPATMPHYCLKERFEPMVKSALVESNDDNYRITLANLFKLVLKDWHKYIFPDSAHREDSATILEEFNAKFKEVTGEGHDLLSTLEANPCMVLMAATCQVMTSVNLTAVHVRDGSVVARHEEVQKLEMALGTLVNARDDLCHKDAREQCVTAIAEKISAIKQEKTNALQQGTNPLQGNKVQGDAHPGTVATNPTVVSQQSTSHKVY